MSYCSKIEKIMENIKISRYLSQFVNPVNFWYHYHIPIFKWFTCYFLFYPFHLIDSVNINCYNQDKKYFHMKSFLILFLDSWNYVKTKRNKLLFLSYQIAWLIIFQNYYNSNERFTVTMHWPISHLVNILETFLLFSSFAFFLVIFN